MEAQAAFPVLYVASLEDALALNTGPLGFTLSWREGTRTAALRAGEITLFLKARHRGMGPSEVILNVPDADQIHAAWAAAGIEI